MQVDVVGVGTACIDLVFMVDDLPKSGDCVIADKFFMGHGGIVGNFLVGCSRLGLKTRYVGKLGSDHYGRLVLEELKQEGVDVSTAVFTDKEPTEIVAVLLEKDGERSFVVSIGATNKLRVEEIDLGKALACRLLYTDGVPYEAVRHLLREAKRRDVATAIDLAASLSVYEKVSAGREDFLELLKWVDVAFPSETFLHDIHAGKDLLKACEALLNLGPKIVVATLGAEGSLIVDKQGQYRVPAFEVKVTDTTGAGDAYRAAFIHAYLRGLDLHSCGVVAAAAAALNCQVLGAREGMPRLGELQSFLQSKGFEDIAKELG